jgi:hypothetical protein
MTSDRRRFRRAASQGHRILSARVRPGDPAIVIDVSAGGASVEISRRLLPGSIVDLQVETAQRRVTLRGRVLRCAIVRLRSTSVWYRAAIAFDNHCLWLGDEAVAEYPVPPRESASSRDRGVDPTPEAV